MQCGAVYLYFWFIFLYIYFHTIKRKVFFINKFYQLTAWQGPVLGIQDFCLHLANNILLSYPLWSQISLQTLNTNTIYSVLFSSCTLSRILRPLSLIISFCFFHTFHINIILALSSSHISSIYHVRVNHGAYILALRKNLPFGCFIIHILPIRSHYFPRHLCSNT